MDVLVCVKRVPLTGGKMVLTADDRAIETRHLGFTISPHEECGVEEAVRIVEAAGGSVTVVLPGAARGRGAAARVPGAGRRPGDPARDRRLGLGPRGDRRRLAEVTLRRVRPTSSIFGNESADSCGFQVGIRVAHAMGRPIVTGLKALAVEDRAVRAWPSRRPATSTACRCPPS